MSQFNSRSYSFRELWAGILLFCSLAILRHQLVLDMGLTYSKAFSVGLAYGWFYDGIVVLLVVALSNLCSAFKIPYLFAYLTFSFGVWLASIANTLYFRFFGTRLDLWIVNLHWRDLFMVKGSAAHLGWAWPVLLSGAFFSSVMWIVVKHHKLIKSSPSLLRSLFKGLFFLVFVILLKQSPIWFRTALAHWNYSPRSQGNILSEQILIAWWHEAFGNEEHEARTNSTELLSERLENPGQVLGVYRDLRLNNTQQKLSNLEKDIKEETQDSWPLFRELAPDPIRTRELRKEFGLPESGPVNIVFIFLESVRVYEFLHPDLGPQIYPRMRSAFEKNGIFFSQTYSSSFSAGQTARGHFSTLCSMLPNMTGAATYIAHPTVRIRCLPELLHEAGYQTLWFSAFEKTFHNSSVFESLHGTEKFYDKADFEARGYTERVGDWGIGDGPFLLETLKILESHSQEGRPFFANIKTVSTHHPHSVIPEGALSSKLMSETDKVPDYQAFLSRARYLDESFGKFFEEFLKSPISQNTLLVVLADHSIGLKPHLKQSKIQKREAEFRIPLAFMSKGIGKSRIENFPVHQVDVAPTVAEIAGIGGKVTWVGRRIFSEREGSPWVYSDGRENFNYRFSSSSCYSLDAETGLQCFALRGGDPLFMENLQEKSEDSSISNFLKGVVRANRQAIVTNRIAPR